jgi:mono/diheme cytochrome c family protein
MMDFRRHAGAAAGAAVLLGAGPGTAAETLDAQIAAGEAIFAEHCAECHGADGQGGRGYANPIIETRMLDRFGDARRLWQYTAMMMPFQEPGSLAPELIWDVTAWLMAQNGWLDGLGAPLGPDNAREVAIGP